MKVKETAQGHVAPQTAQLGLFYPNFLLRMCSAYRKMERILQGSPATWDSTVVSVLRYLLLCVVCEAYIFLDHTLRP